LPSFSIPEIAYKFVNQNIITSLLLPEENPSCILRFAPNPGRNTRVTVDGYRYNIWHVACVLKVRALLN